MEPEKTSALERSLAKLRQSTVLRLLVIGILILILLIPTGMLESIINEREGSHDKAVEEISDKWGNKQTITGPVLAVPYWVQSKDEKGVVTSSREYMYYLPDNLDVTGDMQSQKRHRGIYEAVLYETKLHFKGNFAAGFLNATSTLPASAELKNARLLFGVTDVRGIRNSVSIAWDSSHISAQPGGKDEVVTSGFNFPMDKQDLEKGGSFSMDLQLAGSGSLDFTPVGKTSTINLTSNWPSPSFFGAFLPTSDSVTKQGFESHWKVLELNRNFNQSWAGDNKEVFHNSDFGVRMYVPADQYQKSHRAVHYCILFISLTFIFYFIIELRSGANVNPVQYLLVGLAISIFYLLLLSMSEWLGFNTSFFISAASVTTLIALFSLSVLQSKFYALIAGVVQVLLYVFLFTTLQLEDLSLLIGSIGLFITLAILMYFSGKLNREKSI